MSELKKYGTAIIDPPWSYTTKQGGKVTGCADDKYAVLSNEDLSKLPIGNMADYIFLWTTVALIEGGFKVVRDWGFNPITTLPWIKINEVQAAPAFKFKPTYGVGYWFRGCVEYIIVAKKPGVKSIRTNYIGLLSENAYHSRKPDSIHEIVEECFPGPYVEIFSRREESHPTWDHFGNEINGKDIREELSIYECV